MFFPVQFKAVETYHIFQVHKNNHQRVQLVCQPKVCKPNTMKGSSHHSKLEEKTQRSQRFRKHRFLRKFILAFAKSVKEALSGRRWCYQKFEQPEAWLVVAGLEGIDEEEEKEAIQGQRISLHGYQDAIAEEAGQQADTPQHTQETCNLHKHTCTEKWRYFSKSKNFNFFICNLLLFYTME